MNLFKVAFFHSLFLLTIFLSACSNPVNPNALAIDPNIFFTINFNGQTMTQNGLTGSESSSNLNIQFAYVQINTNNNNGSVSSNLLIEVEGSSLNNARDLFNTEYHANIPVQKCNATILLTKQGNALGNYQIVDYGIPANYSSNITDITIGNKKYDIDPANSAFIVTSVDVSIVAGNFTCTLIDGANRIPASGSFRLYKL